MIAVSVIPSQIPQLFAVSFHGWVSPLCPVVRAAVHFSALLLAWVALLASRFERPRFNWLASPGGSSPPGLGPATWPLAHSIFGSVSSAPDRCWIKLKL